MRRLSTAKLLLLAAAGFAIGGVAKRAESADHRDAPATIADPASDINDVFAFNDGSNFVMAMTVFPFAPADAKFSSTTKYVFHTASSAMFGAPTSTPKDFICTFDASQKISCWAGTDDYVTGDASATTGLMSTSGKMKVYAGKRADPFFFNLQGFKDTVKLVENATLPAPDVAGCPPVDPATSAVLVNTLMETKSTDPMASGKMTADDFGTANTLAIVISVPKTLVTSGGAFVSVWGATTK